MNSLGLPDTFIVYTVLPGLVSCFACLWLFFNYAKLPNKTTGIKMILTLSISDFIYHISVLFTLIQFSAPVDAFLRYISSITIHFSTAWPPVIAYLVYISLKEKDDAIDVESYFRRSLVGILSISLLTTQM